jgi:E3 ubiquitin-protein ligase HUWE1
MASLGVGVCVSVGGWVSVLQEVIANGTSVKLQFYRTLDADPAKASESEEGAATVLLHNVHQMPGTDEEVYAGVMRDHRVPPESEFSLRSKLRLARSFPISERRLQWVRVQVTAMTVLANCHAAYNAGQVPVNEAQLSELMGLLHPEGSEVGDGSLPLDLQTLALKALTTLLSERSRATAALLSSAAAAHHGILASLMRKAKVQVNDVESPMLADRLKFGEAMLAFTWMFASTSTGSNALNSAGIMNFILPIVQECDARRVRFTIFAVKTLEVLMNYSPEMQQTFRDGDGLNILVERAHAESFALIRNNQNPEMDTDGKPSGAEAKAAEDTMVQDADACFRPFIVKQDGDDEKFERGKLLSQLMHLMASAGTPIATSGDVRELMQARKKLPRMLHHIFVNSEKFGPNVFEKAAALLTEFVHQEPSCLQHVIDDKVAEAILRTISNSDDQRLPISRGTVTIVPTVIGALCLTPSGTQIVDQMTPIDKFLRCLASEKVVPLLVGETPTQLGAQLEELMRHNPPLLNPCITGCVQIANRIFEICDELASSSGNEMMQETGGSSCPEPEAGADNPLLRSLLCRRGLFYLSIYLSIYIYIYI